MPASNFELPSSQAIFCHNAAKKRDFCQNFDANMELETTSLVRCDDVKQQVQHDAPSRLGGVFWLF
jgi:hypothetical protein